MTHTSPPAPHLPLCKWEVREKIRSLRHTTKGGEQPCSFGIRTKDGKVACMKTSGCNHQVFADLRIPLMYCNMLWGDSFWSDSKFIASTGQVSLDVLMKYVESQNEPKKEKK